LAWGRVAGKSADVAEGKKCTGSEWEGRTQADQAEARKFGGARPRKGGFGKRETSWAKWKGTIHEKAPTEKLG